MPGGCSDIRQRMNRKEKADYAARTLAELYPHTPIPLDHEDAFTLLVAVVLSAQCTDKKVNEITPLLFGKARRPPRRSWASIRGRASSCPSPPPR